MIATWNHYGNPMHAYCRLVDLGMSRRWAMRVAKAWAALYRRLDGWAIWTRNLLIMAREGN